ncbi:glutathione S-transferase 1-like [Ostrinia furnacalis]|uniref:Glutathione S-transferase epsilon 1 n=1 Tax=Ostrinia furnacalis TaxID=93504 RepID=A0A6C0W955_OSTFU|nr:glutathione S-transferase 1-like [Ostrinia furnacalis]XP_028162198.1 glutathione S-transferase 1-like [Ostrinia furnacalis]XP_028162199.1 glutathione S-transferase 1-like [Ostrinia furnacalis]QIC35741.1 glutathione S-transferase epsilon 1 [Ostrinia furnacalis]
MKTILYKTDQSPPARAVKMLVHILGLDIEQRDLNPILREQDTPELRKKNPMRTVPFIDEGDFALSDSHAIVIYLLDKYGGPEHEYLYPKDRRKRATVHQRLFFNCGVLFQRLRTVMVPTYMGQMSEMPKEAVWGIKNAYSTTEEYLSQTTYLADDVMTVADICAFSTLSSLDGLVPVDGKKYPKLKQWLKIMYAKDFSKIANEPGCNDHVAYLKILMDHNRQNQKSKL